MSHDLLFDPEPAAFPTTPMTERQVLDLLHERYSQIERGTTARRFACAEHVASYVGMYPPAGQHMIRRADFIAQDCHAGLLLHGHEVKVTRSDWLTELRDPLKAEAIKRYCDRWWLVAADKAIVRDDLPDGWGLMVPDKTGRLRTIRRAPVLSPEPMPTAFRASLLRATQKTAARRGWPS